MEPITLRSDYASNMLTSLLVVVRSLPEVVQNQALEKEIAMTKDRSHGLTL